MKTVDIVIGEYTPVLDACSAPDVVVFLSYTKHDGYVLVTAQHFSDRH